MKNFPKTLHFALLTFSSWQNQAGQALVTLLFFSIIAATITSAATVVVLTNSQAASTLEQGTLALSIAESGAENAILRILRDPNYTNETFPVDGGTAAIQVTGTNPKIITSEGSIGNFKRIIEVQLQNTNNTYTISSWKEI